MTTSIHEGLAARAGRAMLAVVLAIVLLALYIHTPSPSNDIKFLVLAWCGPLLAAYAIVVRRNDLRFGPAVAATTLLSVLFLVGAVLSDHPAHGLLHATRFWSFAMLAVAAALLYTRPVQLRWLSDAVIGATLVASGYGFLQYLGLDPMPWDAASMADEAYRGLPATFGNANLAAHVLVLVVILTGYRALTAPSPVEKVVFGFCAAVFALHLAYTGQRAALLALVATGVFVGLVLVFQWRKVPPRRAIPIMLMLTFLAVTTAGVVTLYVMKYHPGSMPLDGSLLLRYNAYFGAAEMITDRPLLGFGCGNYVIENTPYWTPYEQRWFAERFLLNYHVHSAPLETGVEGGMPAVFLHLTVFVAGVAAFVMAALGAGPVERRIGLAFAAFVVAFFVDGLFGFNLRSPASGALFFAILGAGEGVLGARHPVTLPAGSWRRRCAMIFVVVMALLTAGLGTTAFRGAIALKSGSDALASNANDVAETYLHFAAEALPWSWEARQLRGRALSLLGRREDALRQFEEALERNPNDLSSLLDASQANLALYGDARGTPGGAAYFQASEDCVARAAALCPLLPTVDGMRGRFALIEAQELADKNVGPDRVALAYTKAADYFRSALVHALEDRASLQFFLFQALVGSGDRRGAEKAIQSAVTSDPGKLESWNLYYAFARQDNELDAFFDTLDTIAASNGGIERLPLPAQAIANARKQGPEQWTAMARVLGAYIEGIPVDERGPAVMQGVAWAADSLNGLMAGNDAFVDPALGQFYIAGIYATLNAIELATALAENAYEELPKAEKAAAAVFLANRHSELGHHPKALAYAEEALRLAPQDMNGWITSARVLAAAGQKGPALQRYQQILRQFAQIPPEGRAAIAKEMEALQGPM